MMAVLRIRPREKLSYRPFAPLGGEPQVGVQPLVVGERDEPQVVAKAGLDEMRRHLSEPAGAGVVQEGVRGGTGLSAARPGERPGGIEVPEPATEIFSQ